MHRKRNKPYSLQTVLFWHTWEWVQNTAVLIGLLWLAAGQFGLSWWKVIVPLFSAFWFIGLIGVCVGYRRTYGTDTNT